MAEGDRCVVIRHSQGSDTAQQCAMIRSDVLATRPGRLRPPAEGARVAIQICIVTGRGLRHGFVSRYNARHCRGGLRHDAQQRARGRGDTARDTAGCALRHGWAKPVTRLSQACNIAQCARMLGQGWVYCALDSVLTQCTVLSHCL